MSFFGAETKSPKVYFPWIEADYTVGLRRFDEEHRRLAELLNQLHVAMVERRDRSLAHELLGRFQKEARIHFESEEAALKETGYPDQEAHFAGHTDLLQELRELEQRYLGGSLSALVMLDFLKNWLVQHIKVSDRKYTAHLRRNGFR